MRLLGQIRVAQKDAGAGEINGIEVIAAEHRAGRALHRQLDGALQRSVRRPARETPAVPHGVPQIALGIDGGAVRAALHVLGRRKNAAVCNLTALGVEIIGPDGVDAEIGIIHRRAVRAEGEGIGADDVALRLVHAEIGI